MRRAQTRRAGAHRQRSSSALLQCTSINRPRGDVPTPARARASVRSAKHGLDRMGASVTPQDEDRSAPLAKPEPRINGGGEIADVRSADREQLVAAAQPELSVHGSRRNGEEHDGFFPARSGSKHHAMAAARQGVRERCVELRDREDGPRRWGTVAGGLRGGERRRRPYFPRRFDRRGTTSIIHGG
jgi:hypothetical protein